MLVCCMSLHKCEVAKYTKCQKDMEWQFRKQLTRTRTSLFRCILFLQKMIRSQSGCHTYTLKKEYFLFIRVHVVNDDVNDGINDSYIVFKNYKPIIYSKYSVQLEMNTRKFAEQNTVECTSFIYRKVNSKKLIHALLSIS